MPGKRRVRKSKWLTPAQARAKKGPGFEEESSREKKAAGGWMVSITLATFLVAAIVGFVLWEGNSKLPDASPEVPKEVSNFELQSPPEDWTGLLPWQVAQKFSEATSVEDRLQWLDQLENIEERAREFFTSGPGSREKIIKRKRHLDSKGKDGIIRVRFLAELESGKRRLLCIKALPAGPKIDFDAYSCYCSESWSGLLAGHVMEAQEMRLFLRPSNYYPGEFSDDSVWQCFQGTSLDLEGSVYLYFKKDALNRIPPGSIQHRKLSLLTVSLKAHGKSYQNRQFELTKILQRGWLSRD